MRLIININDESKAHHFISFLKDIPFIEIQENFDASTEKSKLDELFGIWKDYDITLDDIRNKAWKQ